MPSNNRVLYQAVPRVEAMDYETSKYRLTKQTRKQKSDSCTFSIGLPLSHALLDTEAVHLSASQNLYDPEAGGVLLGGLREAQLGQAHVPAQELQLHSCQLILQHQVTLPHH